MTEMLELCKNFIKPKEVGGRAAGYGHISGSNVQLANWTDAIQKWMKADSGTLDGSPKDQTRKECLFGCVMKSIYYARDQCNASRNLQKSL